MSVQTHGEVKRYKKRVNFLIYPKFQLGMILINLFLIIFVFGVTFFQAFGTFRRFSEIGESIQLPPDHAYFRLIEFQGSRLYSSLIVSFTVAFILSGILTLLISHRLAGPIVRLRGYFRRIAQTRSVEEPLKFRERDFFDDLPDAINDAMDALGQKPKNSRL